MLVDFKVKGNRKTQYNLAEWTARQMDRIKILINEEDRDYVIVVTGDEGAGKSLFSSQLAYYVDKTFTHERMCLTPDDFVQAILNAKKGQAIVFDEAYTGLASSASMSAINKLMREYMMEMRKRNLFVIICIPSVFYLDKYVALHRARACFRVYFSRGKRGQYMVYNKKKLKLLYLIGRKKMSYAYPTIHIKKRFPNIAPINWKAYEKRHQEAMKKKKPLGKRTQKQIIQRDIAIYYLNQEKKMNYRKIKELYENWSVQFPIETIRDIILKMKKASGRGRTLK